jgi:hypothetical protein
MKRFGVPVNLSRLLSWPRWLLRVGLVPPHGRFWTRPHEERQMLRAAYLTATRTKSWDFLNGFSGESFMFDASPEARHLLCEIDKDFPGHSGASGGYTCRILEYIAKKGWGNFCKL